MVAQNSVVSGQILDMIRRQSRQDLLMDCIQGMGEGDSKIDLEVFGLSSRNNSAAISRVAEGCRRCRFAGWGGCSVLVVLKLRRLVDIQAGVLSRSLICIWSIFIKRSGLEIEI